MQKKKKDAIGKLAYTRLSAKERERISRGLARGWSYAHLARRINRPTSAVSREVRAHGGKRAYRAVRANRQAQTRASSRRGGKRTLLLARRLRQYVHQKLRLAWSPDEIARRLAAEYPHDAAMRISPEAIYQYVYVLPRGALKRSLIKGLRQERAYRRKRKGAKSEEPRGRIADMRSIEERPAEVEGRIVPGHWEGDLIVGRHKQSALGTLVERTTRFTLLVPLKTKDAATVRKAYARALRGLPRALRASLTYDQGKEMSEHARFTVDTGIVVYFAHPGSPWERGTNENTNGLVRQFFPKGTDFRKVTNAEVRRAQHLLNGRPRRSLGYRKPIEVFNEALR